MQNVQSSKSQYVRTKPRHVQISTGFLWTISQEEKLSTGQKLNRVFANYSSLLPETNAVIFSEANGRGGGAARNIMQELQVRSISISASLVYGYNFAFYSSYVSRNATTTPVADQHAYVLWYWFQWGIFHYSKEGLGFVRSIPTKRWIQKHRGTRARKLPVYNHSTN